MTRPQGFLLAALFVVGGCATGDSGVANDCSTGHERPFGQRFQRFFTKLAGVGPRLSKDWDNRLQKLANSRDRYTKHVADNARRTGRRLANIAPTVGTDAVCRTSTIGARVAKVANRAVDDANCFTARAWHSIKMLE